ncbi:hypothetical protein SPRG_13000 [Saprolegnia parasitica CBS 223.65]|uniref:F-box domain-containing protein n=1 Tax=Saprolegnia parasitica (strain CBS 223.65) TaxID=695850 RepID=A0A067C4F6_SAPPC|nr:hypothetical protein SPRG_13000 [Saprolegnia parasitica CBS 223.65]KDO21662.1 hypothetical protein SPRG_13000 [Saprolegnia parasitica CBS 223.65]|eukprot:XP_012207586.1 hypothetical protein SPRG_13000 [Saprolegnia parasitica CBS 223.65]
MRFKSDGRSASSPKAARVTLSDALALPHVIEAIATSLDNQDDFSSFFHAVPRSLWTPALTAFLDCSTTTPPSVHAYWPHIKLRDMDLPPSVLALLAATLPLRPRIELQYVIRDAARLVSLVAALGPALRSIFLDFDEGAMIQGQGRAISNLLLQRCPRLRHMNISVISCSENEAVELNDLLAVVAHPHVHNLSISLESVTIAPPRLGHHLATWLSTARPATILSLAHIDQMDHEGAIAFYDALQANTTLQELIVYNTPALGGFHGRTLPVSLKRLRWNVDEVVDAAMLTDLATAVGPTQLEHLECIGFGQLATCPAAAPMLSQLQSLTASSLYADDMESLIAGVSLVPALTYLVLRGGNLSTFMELLLEALATTCMRLSGLAVDDRNLTRDGATAVLSGVLRLPRLTSLRLSMHLLDVLHVLPEHVAAGRHLRCLTLKTIEFNVKDEEKCAIYKALAQVPDVPFVLQRLPKDMEKFVVDALSPRADRRHECSN